MRDAPSSDVLEVSLIGPGYGESVLVHLGDGEWVIVDSCVEKDSQGSYWSSAVSYLKRIGVNLAERVSHVVATHWHDDHIAGLSQVVNDCESADFCCPVVLAHQEFRSFAAMYADANLPQSARTTQEIMGVLELLQNRGKKPKFLASDKLVYKTDRGVSVFSLSPSDDRISDFLSCLAAKMPELGAPVARVGDMRPNEISAALLIDLGNDSILLGADLEETPGNGWSAVVNSCESVRGKRSSVYKIAHHGSQTGDCAAIWEKLLLPAPFAVLAPFRKGRKPLPSRQDVDRILKKTTKAYSSARMSSTGPDSPRDASVENIVREHGGKICDAHPKQGHLRLRRRIEAPPSEWSIELGGNAAHLRDIWT